ncbi:LysM peptidoglycan-binding domain-containing protein [Nanchangia anserum]|uniref:LysM peptidoglycan-binding domain-containing protein n=1 Tax=Nanchangia anserum TaxID=2692125 RepID=A0A8I0GAP8_9ACTO|nr:LysM peptidoglycan-binding domain-containing protein [Nanchangia anserum]MBD3690254.1 LysM peptidoglycan-binding domain-containing protein [Nanchangia anserum]QOX82305.1 LysM peptidoglycan-binding domain-containing protein [Nanchangia anserum]
MATSHVMPPLVPAHSDTRRPHLRVIPGGLEERRSSADVWGPREAILRARQREVLARQQRAVGSPVEPREATPRRPVVTVLASIAFLMGCAGIGWVGGTLLAPDAPEAGAVYTVHDGDTLWSIAQRTTPGHPEDGAEAIRQLNGMESSNIAAGQQIRLPR